MQPDHGAVITMKNMLEDKDAIRETMANYCFHFDGGDIDNWVALFTEDGVFNRGEYGIQNGRAELRAFFTNYPMPDGTPGLMHFISNIVIDVNGDRATSKSYVLVVRPSNDGGLVNGLAGRYEDQLIRSGDRWLFKVRKVTFDFLGEMR